MGSRVELKVVRKASLFLTQSSTQIRARQITKMTQIWVRMFLVKPTPSKAQKILRILRFHLQMTTMATKVSTTKSEYMMQGSKFQRISQLAS